MFHSLGIRRYTLGMLANDMIEYLDYCLDGETGLPKWYGGHDEQFETGKMLIFPFRKFHIL